MQALAKLNPVYIDKITPEPAHYGEKVLMAPQFVVKAISDPRQDSGRGSEVWSLSGGIVQTHADDPSNWTSRFLLEAIPEFAKDIPIDDPQQPACFAIKQCMQGKPGFAGSAYHSAALEETIRCGCRYCGAVCEITTESIGRDIRIGYWKDTLSVTFDAFRRDGKSQDTVRTKLLSLIHI